MRKQDKLPALTREVVVFTREGGGEACGALVTSSHKERKRDKKRD